MPILLIHCTCVLAGDSRNCTLYPKDGKVDETALLDTLTEKDNENITGLSAQRQL